MNQLDAAGIGLLVAVGGMAFGVFLMWVGDKRKWHGDSEEVFGLIVLLSGLLLVASLGGMVFSAVAETVEPDGVIDVRCEFNTNGQAWECVGK